MNKPREVERKNKFSENRGVGFENKFEFSPTPEIYEVHPRTVRGRAANFEVTASKYMQGETVFESVYILQIDFKRAEDAHAAGLILGGWNSYICYDYSEEAEALAEEFCNTHNLTLNHCVRTWPSLIAMVSKPYEPVKKEAYSDEIIKALKQEQHKKRQEAEGRAQYGCN